MEMPIKRGDVFNYVEMEWVGSGSAKGTFRKSCTFYAFFSEQKKHMQNCTILTKICYARSKE